MEKEIMLRLQYLFGEFLENANNIIAQEKDRQNKLHIDFRHKRKTAIPI